MRRFIVVKRYQEELTHDIKISLDLYDKESLVSLLLHLNIRFDAVARQGQDIETAISEYIIKHNVDGDAYYRISEVIGDRLKHLIF